MNPNLKNLFQPKFGKREDIPFLVSLNKPVEPVNNAVKPILPLAPKIIDKNVENIPKDLYTNLPIEDKISLFLLYSMYLSDAEGQNSFKEVSPLFRRSVSMVLEQKSSITKKTQFTSFVNFAFLESFLRYFSMFVPPNPDLVRTMIPDLKPEEFNQYQLYFSQFACLFSDYFDYWTYARIHRELFPQVTELSKDTSIFDAKQELHLVKLLQKQISSIMQFASEPFEERLVRIFQKNGKFLSARISSVLHEVDMELYLPRQLFIDAKIEEEEFQLFSKEDNKDWILVGELFIEEGISCEKEKVRIYDDVLPLLNTILNYKQKKNQQNLKKFSLDNPILLKKFIKDLVQYKKTELWMELDLHDQRFFVSFSRIDGFLSRLKLVTKDLKPLLSTIYSCLSIIAQYSKLMEKHVPSLDHRPKGPLTSKSVAKPIPSLDLRVSNTRTTLNPVSNNNKENGLNTFSDISKECNRLYYGTSFNNLIRRLFKMEKPKFINEELIESPISNFELSNVSEKLFEWFTSFFHPLKMDCYSMALSMMYLKSFFGRMMKDRSLHKLVIQLRQLFIVCLCREPFHFQRKFENGFDNTATFKVKKLYQELKDYYLNGSSHVFKQFDSDYPSISKILDQLFEQFEKSRNHTQTENDSDSEGLDWKDFPLQIEIQLGFLDKKLEKHLGAIWNWTIGKIQEIKLIQVETKAILSAMENYWWNSVFPSFENLLEQVRKHEKTIVCKVENLIFEMFCFVSFGCSSKDYPKKATIPSTEPKIRKKRKNPIQETEEERARKIAKHKEDQENRKELYFLSTSTYFSKILPNCPHTDSLATEFAEKFLVTEIQAKPRIRRSKTSKDLSVKNSIQKNALQSVLEQVYEQNPNIDQEDLIHAFRSKLLKLQLKALKKKIKTGQTISERVNLCALTM